MGAALNRLRDAWNDAGLAFDDKVDNTASAQAPGHSPADRSVSIRQIDGQVLMFCHAGHDTSTVLAEVGLTTADLFDSPKGVTYDYPDGRKVHRTPNKKFRQAGNTAGTALYRAEKLPEGKDLQVFVVEGEKDVHALESVGVYAVTSGGANSVRKRDWSPLAGRHVTIVADDDEPGHKYAAQVAAELENIAASITVVKAKSGKDAADHIAAGHTVTEFQKIETKPTGRRLKISFGHEVMMRKIEWLIPDWIPRSALTLLAGREGLGKSTIAVAWTAAETVKGNYVLYVHTEDSREHTVAPRLKAAGADMSKVIFVDVETETSDSGTITLPLDNDALEQVIAEYKVTFMVLDAATSSMSSELSGKDDRQVRQFLEPLAQMAARQKMVVLGLVHFGKRDGADSGKLILGSIAWSQVARSVLSVALDEDQDQLIITNTKGNLATCVRSEAARIVSQAIDTEDGSTEVGKVKWLGEVKADARDFLAGDAIDGDERTEIEKIILDYLKDNGGSAPAKEVLKATRDAGLDDNTVKKARRKMGVKTEKAGGTGVGWVWTIDYAPEAEQEKPEDGKPEESKVPKESKGAHARVKAPLDSLPESSTPVPAGTSTTLPTPDAHRDVIGALSATYGLDARTIAGSVSPRYRDQVPAILQALVAEGIATTDGTKYLRATDKREVAA
ncbi:AAA family ATPase [Dietzia maris]|uniref:AAA family ATPase n=1 Tax=Dietzia maris TaxID=37915 RepID=A0ABT8GYL9_9ACTN|nr:AAA family ATPase [Dietzia maris]MCZ4539851.1 AAA family ATPase [Dietzia maris]MDN4505309.1 AAA family ATPase [Dietzia maris]